MAVAALAPLLAAKGTKGSSDATAAMAKALTNDIAVVHTSRVGGKGKRKHVTDYEVHINPVSLAVGAAAVGGAVVLGAAGLYLAGVDVTRSTGATKTYTVRKDGDVWRVYSPKGVPLRTLGAEFMPDMVLSDTEKGQGWEIAGIRKDSDTLFTFKLKNDQKRVFGLRERDRKSWINIGGGGIL